MTTPPPWVPVTDRPAPPPRPTTPLTNPAPVPAGDRERRWAAAALAGEAADIAAMEPDSGRNHALNGAAYKLGRLVAGGLLGEADVRQALTDAAAACGLPAGEATRTITSGLTAGMRAPRTRTGRA